MNYDNIEDVMAAFCQAGAEAVQRYCRVSGEDPWSMPEYFMPAFILNQLGDVVTATLETNFGVLLGWNEVSRRRLGKEPRPHDPRLLRLAQQLGGRRVDMVLFKGQEQNVPKNEQDFLALVEFKRALIDAERTPGRTSDRDKLLMLLEHIDTCPWGITCGWLSQNQYDWQKNSSIRETEDRWYEQEVELPAPYTYPIYFCARLIRRSSDNARLNDLLATFPAEIDNQQSS